MVLQAHRIQRFILNHIRRIVISIQVYLSPVSSEFINRKLLSQLLDLRIYLNCLLWQQPRGNVLLKELLDPQHECQVHIQQVLLLGCLNLLHS